MIALDHAGTAKWSDTMPWREHRPPYLPAFLEALASRLHLTGREAVLDLGCGPGGFLLGLAPYVGSLAGLDPDGLFLDVLAQRARAIGRDVTLIRSTTEAADPGLGPFDLITIGRAFAYMRSPETLSRIERWLASGGHVVVGGPVETSVDDPPWLRAFFMVAGKWTKVDVPSFLDIDADDFFASGAFERIGSVEASAPRTIQIEDLVQRAYAMPFTSPTALGPDAERMAAHLRKVMAHFFRDGPIVETVRNVGTIYRRRNRG